jgi:hypothetical protein
MTSAEIRAAIDAANQRRTALNIECEQLALPSMSDAKARARHHKVSEELSEIDRDLARHKQALERATALEAEARAAADAADAAARRTVADEEKRGAVAEAARFDRAVAEAADAHGKMVAHINAAVKTRVVDTGLANRLKGRGPVVRAVQAAGAAGVLGTEVGSHAHAQSLQSAAESLLGAAVPRADSSKAA